jgi:hypothetical protein
MNRVFATATVRRLGQAAFGFCLLLTAGASAAAQARRTVLVIEFGTGRPLANAEVVNRASGEALLTNAQGEAALPDRWTPVVALRIRQIGFRFADTTLARDDTSRSIRVVLLRVAYVLPAVGVAVGTSCTLNPTADAALLAATALEQLQMAAERYNTFKRLHPFRAHLERRTKFFSADGKATADRIRPEVTASSDWGERYDPKRIVEDNGFGFSVQILFLAHLADPVFWRRHCFEVDGIAPLAGRPMIRLRFAPLATVRDPEWEGWAFLDSATSELRRLEFRLSRIPEGTRPRKLEGYTTFMSPISNIVLPESTVAIWWRRKPPSDSALPDILQLLRLVRVEYRGQVP